MNLREMIRGGGTQPDAGTRQVLMPVVAVPRAEKGSILSTFNGFGPNGWGKEAGLAAAARFNLITSEQHAAALGAPIASATQGAVEVGPRAAFAAGAVGAASTGVASTGVASSNPIYGGMYAQMLNRTHGFQVPAMRAEQLPGAVAAVAAEAPDVVAPAVESATAVDTPVVAAADDVAAKMANLEQQLIEGFQRLGALPVEQRIPTLAKAIDVGAAAGHGDDAFGVLAATLAARPLEHSVPALSSAIDDAVKLAPVAAEVVAKSAPVLDDVAHAAATVVKPSVVEAVLPVTDDALRNGLAGAMSFSAGIDDTLRLLAKF